MRLLHVALIGLLLSSIMTSAIEQSLVEQSLVEQPLVVIIPSYKNAKYYKQNLDSVFNQHYTNYRVVYVADGDLLPESDKTGEFVKNYVTEKNQWHRFTLIRNADRQLALKNWYKAVLSCKDEEIVVALDGDDWFAHRDVLAHINQMYSKPGREMWFTYGNYQFLSSGQVWDKTQAVPQDVAEKNALRQWGNGPTHLKTFKAWLFKQIKIGDLFYDDDFYRMAPDIAMYTPMIEMAIKHYDLTQEVMYIYNDMNVLNEHRVDRNLQWLSDYHVRHKPAYQPLETSKSGLIDVMSQQGLLKADVIYSANDLDSLRFMLGQLRMVQNVGTIFIIQPTNNLCSEDQLNVLKHDCPQCKFIKKTELQSVMSNGSGYVLMLNGEVVLGIIDLQHVLYWLETSHAHAFYLNLNKNTVQALKTTKNITVPLALVTLHADESQAIYGWKYRADASELQKTEAVVCRKSDVHDGIVSMPADGVGLFYRG